MGCIRLKKSANVGIGAMIIMIATILIVAIFITLYLTATNKLESQSYKATDKTQEFVSTKLIMSEPTSEFEDGKLKTFTIILKLAPGSSPVSLETTNIMITTGDERTTLNFAGHGALTTHSPAGFYSLGVETYDVPSTPDDDFDMDGIADEVYVNNTRNSSSINISSEGRINLGNCSSADTFQKFTFTSDYIEDVTGSCVDWNVTNITITPTNKFSGKFSISYMMQSENGLPGFITRGDVVKAYFETSEELGLEETVTLDTVPKSGNPTTLMFITPDKEKVGTVFLSHY